MKTFKLFDREFTVTDEMEQYNVVRVKFDKLAESAAADYREIYDSYPKLEKVLGDFDSQYGRFMRNTIKEAITMLIENKIYDIDENRYFSMMDEYGYLLTADDAYSTIYEKYVEIEEGVESGQQYRSNRKASRGRVIGGGFGMSGAMKGMATAGALNMGAGALHSAGNLIGNAIDRSEANDKKAKLLKNANTRNSLVGGIYNDCLCVHVILVEILQNNGFAIKNITKSQINTAAALFNAVKNPAFPKGEIMEKMVTVLENEPYNLDYYAFLIRMYKDENKHVETLANYFGVDTKAFKKSLVSEFYSTLQIEIDTKLNDVLSAGKRTIEFKNSIRSDIPQEVHHSILEFVKRGNYARVRAHYESLPKNSLEKLCECKEKVMQFAEKSEEEIQSFYPSSDYESFEIKESGFFSDKVIEANVSVIYDELDALILEAKIKLAQARFDSLPKTTEEEALSTKDALLQYCKEIDLTEANPVIEKINSTLVQIDINIRTVEGIEFKTREEASTAREEKTVLDNIVIRNALVTRGDFSAILSEISEVGFESEIKEVYIDRYTEKSTQFEKKLETAKNHEYKKTSKKKFTGFKNIISDVSSLLGGKGEENAWNELTHNGKYGLDFVESDARSEPVSAEHIATATAVSDDSSMRITNILSSVNEVLRKKIHVGDSIPQKKFANAKQAYATNLGDRNPLEKAYMLYDPTLFGSAKTGFLLTNERFYYATSDTCRGFVDVSEITSVTPKLSSADIEGMDDEALLEIDNLSSDLDTMLVQAGNDVREILPIENVGDIAKIIQAIVHVLNGVV